MWMLLLALACSKPPTPAAEPAPVSAPDPVPVSAPKPVVADAPAAPACVDTCMRQGMARPVSREQLEADCRRECEATGAIVRSTDDLDLRLGQRVVLEGTYERRLLHGHGPEPYICTAIVLPDGTPVWVATGATPPKGWSALIDAEVQVEATLSTSDEGAPGVWLHEPGTPERQ